MVGDREILDYQQKCFYEYAPSINLPEKYTYPDGNPIRPLPPIQTQTQGLMIVGAYPSARFESRPSPTRPGIHRLIPVADNLQPFGREEYFDGTRIRSLTSADTLKKFILDPLGLKLGDCWVTDLVKVFLYKPSHADSLSEVKPEFTVPVLRNQYYDLGRKSLTWLKEECHLSRPQLIVTLGQEVAQVINGKKNASADELLKNKILHSEELDDLPTIHVPHPDACRRMEKWREHLKKQIEKIQKYLLNGGD